MPNKKVVPKAIAHISIVCGAQRKEKTVEINRVVLLGGGTMGSSLAVFFACCNIPVTVWSDRSRDRSQAQAVARVQQRLAARVSSEEITRSMADRLLARIQFSDALECARGAALIIESIAEDLGAKHSIWQEVGRLGDREAIWATNTSSIDPEQIFCDIEDRRQVLCTHFFNPGDLMPLVELLATDPYA